MAKAFSIRLFWAAAVCVVCRIERQNDLADRCFPQKHVGWEVTRPSIGFKSPILLTPYRVGLGFGKCLRPRLPVYCVIQITILVRNDDFKALNDLSAVDTGLLVCDVLRLDSLPPFVA